MTKQLFHSLLYGWISVLGLILVSSLIVAALLKFTALDAPALTWITLVIGILSLFIGGLIAGMKGKAKGWVIGGLIGIGFTLFTFLVQYLGYSTGFSLQQTLHHLGYVLAAIIGGIIGVNLSGEDNN